MAFFPHEASISQGPECPTCKLVNSAGARACLRCGSTLAEASSRPASAPKPSKGKTLRRRIGICIVVIFCVIAGFYMSLLFSAKGLTADQKVEVDKAIAVLEDRGFADEVFYLRYAAVFRSEDNWLNASVPKENAFAATNFPFEIMTLYPDFFTYPVDNTERAAVLLHEAKHLQGADEKEAYEFVWKNRVKLGWTRDKYQDSFVWENIRRQTKEYVPLMFNCEGSELGDCTEP